jgi:hypothetical protein
VLLSHVCGSVVLVALCSSSFLARKKRRKEGRKRKERISLFPVKYSPLQLEKQEVNKMNKR